MKKSIKILIAAAAAVLLLGGACFGLTRGKTWDKGILLKTEKGAVLWIDEHGSPIQLSFARGSAVKSAEKIASGSSVLLLHDGIEESYPGRTGCYLIVKAGAQKEIPAATLSTLAEMGWLTPSEAPETVVDTAADPAVRYAEGENLAPDPVYATCGNTVTKIRKDGREYSFMYDDSCALFNLLGNLVYSGSAEKTYEDDFAVLLEDGSVYTVSLQNASVRVPGGSELFRRESGGECALTKAQCDQIGEILDRVLKGESAPVAIAADPAGQSNAPADLGAAAAECGIRVFRELCRAKGNENALFSPVSLYAALALTANGAAGDTAAQLEGLLGGNTQALNAALQKLTGQLIKSSQVRYANSVWVKSSGLKPDKSFVSHAKEFFGAQVENAAMDETSVREINDWVKDKTDGKIENLLSSLDENTLLVLANALSFDAQWQEKYPASHLKDGTFTASDGSRQKARMMHSSENGYLETDLARGFIKPYRGGSYAFAALLPNEGVAVDELLSSLSGEALKKLLTNPQSALVQAALPAFGFTDGADLIPALKTLGVKDLFDAEKADLSGFGTLQPPYEALAVSLLLQKTAIDVTPDGTSAAAATVEAATGSGAVYRIETVTLDRPFVFLIFDTATGAPLFIGTVNGMR